MDQVIISTLESIDEDVELVERKGVGHPDTICDALAEALSRDLYREYRHRFGDILHHIIMSTRPCCPAVAPPQCLAAGLSSLPSTSILRAERCRK